AGDDPRLRRAGGDPGVEQVELDLRQVPPDERHLPALAGGEGTVHLLREEARRRVARRDEQLSGRGRRRVRRRNADDRAVAGAVAEVESRLRERAVARAHVAAAAGEDTFLDDV